MLGMVDEVGILLMPVAPAASAAPLARAALRTCIFARLSAKPAIALRPSEESPFRSGPHTGRGLIARGAGADVEAAAAAATGSETTRGGGLGRFIAEAGTGTDVLRAVDGVGRFAEGGGRDPREDGYFEGREEEGAIEAERGGPVGAALAEGIGARLELARDERDEIERDEGSEGFTVGGWREDREAELVELEA